MIEMPPLHALFVHFPVALLPISVTCDGLGMVLKRPSLAHAGWWTLLFATIASPITAATGWLWLNDMEGMDGTTMAVHKWLGTTMPVLLFALSAWRYRLHANDRATPYSYVAAASVVLLAMIVQGHLGATMTFGSSEPQMQAMPSQSAPPETRPTTRDISSNDGWQDSIRVKGQQHE